MNRDPANCALGLSAGGGGATLETRGWGAAGGGPGKPEHLPSRLKAVPSRHPLPRASPGARSRGIYLPRVQPPCQDLSSTSKRSGCWGWGASAPRPQPQPQARPAPSRFSPAPARSLPEGKSCGPGFKIPDGLLPQPPASDRAGALAWQPLPSLVCHDVTRALHRT